MKKKIKKVRNPAALPAKKRKAGKMKDRRSKKKGAGKDKEIEEQIETGQTPKN